MEADAKLAEQARRAVEIEEAARKKAKSKAINGETHPWASLSPSAVKRLTASDLSQFLEERGVKSTDDSGKRLLKRDLLNAVENLL